MSSEEGGGCGGVNKDVVLCEFLNIILNLVHFSLQVLFAALLSNCVELAVVCFSLEVLVKDLPLLLQSSDQLLTLFFRHQHLLLVSLVLLLNLHLSDEVVFVFDFILDLRNVLWHLSVGFLLQHVFLFLSRKLRCCKDVLNRVGNNEVFV